MHSLLKYFKTSLALRTATSILLMVAVVGLAFLVGAIHITQTEEHNQQVQRLNGLLDTVENTVRIAAFLRDDELASEVVAGLLQNPTIQAARIWVDGEVLAEADKRPEQAQATLDTISRKVESPFGTETVGRIALTPDASEIQAEVTRATRYMALMLAVLLVLIGVGIVFVVIHLITRPILQISNRLHGLRAETGEKLEFPRGSETDEIGRLVGDVNALIDHLVNILQEERNLRIEREIAEKKFRTIFESAETGIFVIDEDDSVTSYNPAFERLFGLSSDRSATQASVSLADLFRGAAGNQEIEAFIHRCRTTEGPHSEDFLMPGAKGRKTRWIHVVLNSVEGSQLQGVINDVTRRKQSEETARELAVTDFLTGLSNRLGFEGQLDSLIELCERQPDRRFSLLMLDLDKFKPINDTHGHEAGDDVLKHIARVLQAKMRKTDFVARLGGDEYVVLLDGTTDRAIITEIVDSLLREINKPMAIGDGNQVQMGASIGIALYGSDATSPSDLLRRADEAMYRAKQEGRNTFRFYQDLETG